MSPYKLIFNEIDDEYKVLNHKGHVIWSSPDKNMCLIGAAEFIGCNPEDIEVDL